VVCARGTVNILLDVDLSWRQRSSETRWLLSARYFSAGPDCVWWTRQEILNYIYQFTVQFFSNYWACILTKLPGSITVQVFITACRRKLRGTWSTVAHQFRSLWPSTTTVSQSIPRVLHYQLSTFLCTVAFSVPGPTSWNSLPDRLRDIEFWQFSKKLLKQNYLLVIKLTKRSTDAS